MTRKADLMERAGNTMLYAHYATAVGVGVSGFAGDPSPSVVRVVGWEVATTAFSAMFVLFGGMALASKLLKATGVLETTRSEAVAIVCIGFAYLLFGGLLVAAAFREGGPAAIQTALAILGAGMFLPGVAAIGLAMLRRERLRAQHQAATTGDVLTHLGEAMDRHLGGDR